MIPSSSQANMIARALVTHHSATWDEAHAAVNAMAFGLVSFPDYENAVAWSADKLLEVCDSYERDMSGAPVRRV